MATYFSQFWKLENSRLMGWQIGCLVGTHFPVYRCHFLSVPSQGRGMREISGTFLNKSINSIYEEWPNHLPKAPLPNNTITLKTGFQNRNFGEHEHSVHSSDCILTTLFELGPNHTDAKPMPGLLTYRSQGILFLPSSILSWVSCLCSQRSPMLVVRLLTFS